MVVRIRISWGRVRRQSGARPGVLVSACGHGLSLASVVALLAALWRLGYDLDWTERFAIPQGLFSHWQVWLALAVLLQVAAAIAASQPRRRAMS